MPETTHTKTRSGNPPWLAVHSHTTRSEPMSALSRRSLVTSAAALPAAAIVPAVAAPSTDPKLLALGERLKVLFPNATRARLTELRRQRYKRNGAKKAWEEFSAAWSEIKDVGEAILKIPSTDPIGQGIR